MASDDPSDPILDTGRETVVPLVEESLRIDRRDTLTGRVRVRVSTDTVEELVAQDLKGLEVDVERIPIGVTLEAGAALPQVRTEGDVTIVPIVEEILVVEKRLLLREELRIHRRATTEHAEIPVTLRKQTATIERLPAGAAASAIDPVPEE